MTEEKKRCAKRVYNGSFRGSLCSKPYFATEDGGDWCKVHAPSTIKAKNEKREALWAKQRKQREAGYAIGDAQRAVIDVAKGWISDPGDELNIRALKRAIQDLIDAENKAKAL